ncbi:MAG: molecular chaperone Tir [Symploca sp. SIO3C6]|nr:molecular chaperone Tir [Symploca sp. SIO3C6]
MPRSLRVKTDYIDRVKSAVRRNGYPRQKDLAEDLGLALNTVGNFLNGRAVDVLNFQEICRVLGQDWQEIALLEEKNNSSQSTLKDFESEVVITETYHDEEESFIYVERPPIEELCYETLLQPGSLIRIKAPSLMGKTLLISKVLDKLAKQNFRKVYLNFHLAEEKDFGNLEKFLKWFCVSVSQSLGLENKLTDYWDGEFSTSKVNCTIYFEKYLLAKNNKPLVLCLDEVDRVFDKREVAGDFFGLLRAWHEQGRVSTIWKRLRLVVAHSTEVYIPLHINESPFNVGVPIELPEFTLEQVRDLAKLHDLDWTDAQVKQLMEMVGGHPHLVEQAFSHLKVNKKISLEQLLETAATEEGIYSSHLRRLWRVIEQQTELLEALKKVVTTDTSDTLVSLKPILAYKLHSTGLVDLKGDQVMTRCNLYRQYFRNRIEVL